MRIATTASGSGRPPATGCRAFVFRLIVFAASIAGSAHAGGLSIPAGDSFLLEAAIDAPKARTASRVVVLLHGSGPQTMDEDLSAMCTPGVTSRFFVDLSGALTAKGFTVVRYHKRSYQVHLAAKADPGYFSSEQFKKYAAHPLRYFIDDAEAAVRWVRARYPKVPIFLLGHSEGGIVALQAAREEPSVRGVGVIGFSPLGLDPLLLEQTVYRYQEQFSALDRNHDGFLDDPELAAEGTWATALRAQKATLDFDHDSRVSRDEFLGAQLSNILLDGPTQAEYRVDEAALPRPAAIVRDLAIPVAVFQGEWDNQTPAFHARAVELLNSAVWKKPTVSFTFFPQLGHSLDPRDGPQDLVYRRADPAALATLAAALNRIWK